jgi:glycerol uptake facilitator-like aquaporin
LTTARRLTAEFVALWLYIVAPLAGATVRAVIYQFLRSDQ